MAPPRRDTFDQYVNKGCGPDSCWEWNGGKDKEGYGIYRNKRAHRVAYERHSKVPLSNDIDVLHQCDNPPCCNPGHLFPGTAFDNMRDMVSKDRHCKVPSTGYTNNIETPLGRWLSYLGIRLSVISIYLGLHRNTVRFAAARGATKRWWVKELELLFCVPAHYLTNIPPDDPRSAKYRVAALIAAAEWRLRRARLDRSL